MHPLLFTDADKTKAMTSKLPLHCPFFLILASFMSSKKAAVKTAVAQLVLFLCRLSFPYHIKHLPLVYTSKALYDLVSRNTFPLLSGGNSYLQQQICAFQNKQLLLSPVLPVFPEFTLNSHTLPHSLLKSSLKFC